MSFSWLPMLAVAAAVPGGRDVTANNAFFYYEDLEKAATFYEETLGLPVVADYGFAKILRIAGTSFLTIVDAKSGMHSADEPKTVAIALLTDELEGWYEYIGGKRVPLRNPERGLNVEEGLAHHGFVAIDPGGYFLEFERFNPHPENERLIPVLEQTRSFYPPSGGSSMRPTTLGFKGSVLWMYYRDMAAIQAFYERVLGFELIVDQGWARIYRTSPTGFIGLVDESRGMHRYTKDKAVTISFLTTDVDGWFAHMSQQESFELRHDKVLDEGFVRVFVGYDPENYFLEFDTFMETEANEELLKALGER